MRVTFKREIRLDVVVTAEFYAHDRRDLKVLTVVNEDGCDMRECLPGTELVAMREDADAQAQIDEDRGPTQTYTRPTEFQRLVVDGVRMRGRLPEE